MSKRRLQVFFVLCFFLPAGCGFQTAKYFPWWGTKQTSRELQAQFDEANRLFLEGDYGGAEGIFKKLQQSENTVVAREALYGLACSRFMLAGNREDLLEAVKLLDQWRQSAPAAYNREDPRMLLSLFPEALPPAAEDNSQEALPAEEHFLMRSFDYEKKIAALESRILSLNGRIRELEKQKAALKEMEASGKAMEKALREKEETVRALEEELLKLRSQIKTLETIDQEIQEKKQGISSP